MATTPNPMVGRAKDVASRLTPLQKIAFGAVLLTVVAGGLFLSRTGTAPSMGALYTDLGSADAASVVDALSSRGVTYELTDAGKTVLVPQDQVYDLRVALAGEGLPTTNDGYALLDNQGITTSEFRQRIDYQRALEGELARTLSALEGVQTASVHLALPDESVFIDQPANPTASVLVVGAAIGGVTGAEVEAIVHLVSSSVKDMTPADVTVVDANGTVLSAGGGGAGGGSLSAGSMRAKAEADYEARTTASLMALVSRMTGPSKVAVTVEATLDLDEVQTTTENFEPIGENPEQGQVLSENTSTEEYGNVTQAGDTGVLGPDGAETAPDEETTGQDTDYRKEDVARQYALDREVEQTTEVPGTVEKLHVAVLLDEESVTAEQATQIEEMIATAAGIDPDRGDSVNITRLPFDTSMATEAEELAKAEAAAVSSQQTMGMIRTGAVLFVILIALILGYRSAKNARKVVATPINIGEISTAPQRALVGAGGGGGEVLEAGGQMQILDATPDQDAIVMAELTNMAERRPQEVANVLRTWLAETKGRRP
jgi:flagellar M-ring protein FliF